MNYKLPGERILRFDGANVPEGSFEVSDVPAHSLILHNSLVQLVEAQVSGTTTLMRLGSLSLGSIGSSLDSQVGPC
eukprot:7689556-Karenia_brevis.AAC.1